MSRLAQLLGAWHRPADAPAWIALGIAAALALRCLMPARLRADPQPRARFVTIAAFVAAFLSLGYVAHYLRGGPRIIDATTYFLQGRAISHGAFSWTVPDVSASFRGRFLLFQEPDRLAGIFPPGYPLLLALGFKVGAPMVIGPVLAAAIAVATYFAARELAHGHAEEERVARLATVLSVVCAALRYHTADTMAHGAAALAVTIAFGCALAGRRTSRARFFVLAGLMVGWAASTRMVSALPIGALVAACAWGTARPARARTLAWTAMATLPGLLLLFAASRAATGSAFTSAQLAYYQASDGPPGCFRYGFGKGIGCTFEHGDFVTARLPDGYGLTAALGSTLRRLRMHLTDVANFEPLALLVLVPRSRTARLAQLVVLGQVLAYAPFYFDGNYPGGGARFFADVLPLEHALVALAVADLFARAREDFVRRAHALLALSLAGFAVHASHDHLALAARDGGRPMFEPDVLREAHVTSGLLFFDTDHGFNLAHDPFVVPTKGVLAARLRGDDHDRLLVARSGQAIANVYRMEAGGPTITRWPGAAALTDPRWKFETEADWPPLRQSNGWATPLVVPGGRVLSLTAASDRGATAVVELPVPRAGVWRIRPTIVHRGSGAANTLQVFHAQDRPLASWSWKDGARDQSERLPEQLAELSPPRAFVSMATNREISIDYIMLEAAESRY
jgi:hypothetical protein